MSSHESFKLPKRDRTLSSLQPGGKYYIAPSTTPMSVTPNSIIYSYLSSVNPTGAVWNGTNLYVVGSNSYLYKHDNVGNLLKNDYIYSIESSPADLDMLDGDLVLISGQKITRLNGDQPSVKNTLGISGAAAGTFINGDLYISDVNGNFTQYDGFSSTVVNTFSIGNYVYSLTNHNGNLVSIDAPQDLIRIHDTSGVEIDSFTAGGPGIGIATDGTNIITTDGGTDRVYLHDGISGYTGTF